MNCLSDKAPAGTWRGSEEDGVRIWRGIVYGVYARLRKAEMAAVAAEVQDASVYGSLVPQRSSRLGALLGDTPGLKMEEGKLCLSVYAPSDARSCPVMVWIHGGAYLTGGSEDPRYGAERLVKAGGVVVVKISYRLGAMGYLYLPERGAVNLGLEDQKLALRWIRENIAAFGGDPERVTLFGQSAGAHSIAALIATGCGGERLFCRAILQSPPLGITISPAQASKVSSAFLKALGRSVDEADIEQILDAQQAVSHMRTGMSFMPVAECDGSVVAEEFRDGKLQLVVGYTAEDASPFLAGRLGKMLGSGLGRVAVHMATRKIFSGPECAYAGRMKSAAVPVQTYCFDWSPKGSPFGACHCIELPFILGQYPDWTATPMLKGMTKAEFEANSKACLEAWTGFARSGEWHIFCSNNTKHKQQL